MKEEPQIGDIIMNKDPYDGESPYMIIGIKDESYRCAQGPGKYSSGWEFDYCQIMEKDQIMNSYEKIGHVNLN